MSSLYFPASRLFKINFGTGIFRSRHRCSTGECVRKNCTKFTGRHLRQRFFFTEVAGLSPAALLKKRLQHRCFPAGLTKILRVPYLQNTSGQLLLHIAPENMDLKKGTLVLDILSAKGTRVSINGRKRVHSFYLK